MPPPQKRHPTVCSMSAWVMALVLPELLTSASVPQFFLRQYSISTTSIYVAAIILLSTGIVVYMLLQRTVKPLGELAGQMSSISTGQAEFRKHEFGQQPDEAVRSTVSFFDPRMQGMDGEPAALEADIHRALEQGQLRLFYQLQTDSDGKPLGAEGLIRWQHPQRGMVSPEDFIPAAEQSGSIVSIGAWVIHEACRQLKAWTDDEKLRHLTLAVNVSAYQFQQDDFVASVRQAIEETGVAAHRLKLELTETIFLSDTSSIFDKLIRLRYLGVSIVLDDFGTGYSSLAYLQDMPIDQLKIDRSFVTGLSNRKGKAIVRLIIALGHELGVEVIAEGVETAEQKDFLHLSGCHQYQGYLYSPPLSLPHFINRVTALQTP